MGNLGRKKAQSLDSLITAWIRANRLEAPVNTRLVFSAWDKVSGAGRYTVRRFFRDGRLYITLNSSVIRSQLAFQKDMIIEKINACLDGDMLFSGKGGHNAYVKELILK